MGTMVPSAELIRDSQTGSGAGMMRCWPLPGTATTKPWLWLLSSRRGLKGWADLPAGGTPEATGNPEATNALAVSTQDPECIEEGTPGGCSPKVTLN